MMKTPNTDTDAQITDDVPPSQLIVPDTDTGMRIRGMRADRLAYLLPGGTFVVVGAFTASFGLTTLGALLVGVGVLLLVIGTYLIWTTPAHTSGIDRMRGRVSMALRSWSLPLDRAGAAGIHGVERILDDGSVEMSDGRVVRFSRLPGRNTDYQTTEEAQTMISSLRRGIDGSQQLSDIDFSTYSMSTSPDAADATEKYKRVWLSDRYDRECFRDVVGYLKSIIDFEPQDGENAKSTDWEDYLVVQVGPAEIDAPETAHVDGNEIRHQQQIEAERRLQALREAFASAGVTATPVTAPRHARVVARHWAGTRHPFDFEGLTDGPVSVADSGDVGRSQADDDAPPLESDSRRVMAGLGAIIGGLRGGGGSRSSRSQRHNEQIQELLAASRWDVRPEDDMVVAGDQFCRTYYVGDWPVRPKAKFLKALHTMRGIDMSIRHRFESRDTETAKEEIQQMAGSIDSAVTERKDDANPLDARVLEDEMDAYVQLYLLLHHTDVQAWHCSTYITVRAGDRRAIQEVEAMAERGYDDDELSVELGKRKALEDACDEVEEVLSGASVKPVTDATRQAELFRSAAPTGTNAYAEMSTRSRKRLCGTGAIAATFPPCATTIQHEMGVEIGRNTTNGQLIAIDPFETPPAHRLTLGVTGSGKTWATMKQAVRWYLSDPDDRTLVFVDNKGDFAGVTGLLNGNRITIGGHSTLNPLQMKPLDHDSVEAAGLDPFRAKQRFVTELILDLICETDAARDRYRPLIRDGVDKAMIEAGLDPDDPTTHTPENSPTMADVREAVAGIADDPSAHARYQSVETEIKDNVGALLHRLKSFSSDGEYGFLTGESDATVEPGEITYLDLQQIEGIGEMDDRTTMLSVALGEVHEAVKNTAGKTMFVIDEAHYLLKSPRILNWLEERSRHWRHNEAGLWFVSQHPGDFKAAEDDDEQQQKSVIRDQAQITEFFPTDDKEALEHFDLNREEIAFLREDTTRVDESAKDFSECLIDHPESEGKMRARITVTDAESSIFSYDREDHGPYGNYIEQNWTRNKGLTTDGGER